MALSGGSVDCHRGRAGGRGSGVLGVSCGKRWGSTPWWTGRCPPVLRPGLCQQRGGQKPCLRLAGARRLILSSVSTGGWTYPQPLGQRLGVGSLTRMLLLRAQGPLG